ncbi:MAG: 30S ribosomal protein S6--L-glutamate ligase [Legionellales bacterium]|nr:30S ribosomal protein S6--L-glutamate ligase [Legionellales bacterium]
MDRNKFIEIGWEEWVALPDLHLPAIRARVDTGAKTSALHAFKVEKIKEGNVDKVRFGIHPIPERPEIEVFCTAQLVGEREVTSSSQQTELRYVIRTTAVFGGESWPIELTLANREEMSYRMLLGRSAMENRLVVVPQGSCLLGQLSPDLYLEKHIKTDQKKLKICILSREANSYSTERIASAAEGRGHTVDIINTTKCYVDIAAHKQAIHYQGNVLQHYDVVIPRIGASITNFGLAILRQFETLGTFCLNSSTSIYNSRDKLLAHQLLTRGQIDMPTTAFGHSPDNTKDLIRIVNGAPLVVKLLQGSQGESVVLAETNKAAQAVIQAFRGLGANFIVQEFEKESAGRDIRALVIGNQVVASMERRSEEGDFRSNIHQGGKGYPVKLTPDERKIAIKAAKILGLKFAGVDLLRTSKGAKILEVNSSPGLEGIEGLTKKDIAGKLIDYIEQNAKPALVRRIIG